MIKNLLLDMGGVILDVDYNRIFEGFHSLGVDREKCENIFTQASQMPFVDELEKGEMSPEEFRNELRRLFEDDSLTDEQLDGAWNSMIIGVRKEDVLLLEKIKSKYEHIFLFSNTNEIHMRMVRPLFEKVMGYDIFSELFDASFLSNDVHVRKPLGSAFEKVLSLAGIDRKETLFIDDTVLNTKGAESIGLNVYLLNNGQTLREIHQKNII